MPDRPPTDPRTPAPRTILVVDDDRDVQKFLAERFDREGWRVIGERDGDWALRAFERRHIDAVILDILIPVVNGFQVAERIRQSPRGAGIAIIMLTGIYRGPRHRAESIERFKLLDYLDKPLEVERIVERLQQHFAGLPQLPPVETPRPAARAPSLVDERQRAEKKEVERVARVSARGRSGGDGRGAEPELRGNLKRLPFPRLLAQLHRERRSGGLFLLRDKIKKIIYFQDGHPTFIKSNVLDECLGRVLVRERMISESECEESVRRMKKEARQQGSVLIEMGVISPHNLRFGLELQLQIKLFDIFDWAEGELVFRDDVPMPAETIRLEMPTGQIILEGIRRHYHYDRLQSALRGHMESYPERAAEPERRFIELDLTAAESALVAMMDGRTRLEAILEKLPPGMDGHDARSLVLTLLYTEIVSMRDKPARGKTVPPIVPMPAVPMEIAGGDTVPSVRPESPGDAFSDAELAALLADRRGDDPFRALGLPRDASGDEIDRTYAQLARELHPDRFRGRPATSQALAREAFELVTRAHKALGDTRRREKVLETPPGGTSELPSVEVLIEEATNPVAPSEDPAARALAADRLFREGEARLRARDFGQAEWLFQQAVDLRPDMGVYMAFLGWAVFCARGQHAGAARVALPMLEQACRLAPANEHPHLFLGLAHAALGRDDLAEPELEKAVQCNPDQGEALRELRRIHGTRH